MMLKKIGLVAAVAAAGMALFGGVASATDYNHYDSTGNNNLTGQAGLLNLNNLDVLHNVNVPIGVCGDNVNVLGVQVPVQHVADGLNVPILSPGQSAAAGGGDNCSTGAIGDGGTYQGN